MRKVYERPEAIVTFFDSLDTTSVTTSSVYALKEVGKNSTNTVDLGGSAPEAATSAPLAQ